MARKADFTEEVLLSFLQDFITKNRGIKVTATALATFVNSEMTTKKHVNYRYFQRNARIKAAIKDYNESLKSLFAGSEGAGVSFDTEIDIEELLSRCTSPARTRDVIAYLSGIIEALRIENMQLNDISSGLKKRCSELGKKQTEADRVLSENKVLKKENKNLLKERSELKKVIKSMAVFFENIIVNDCALHHLAELHLLPALPDELKMLSDMPDSWKSLFTDETDLLGLFKKLSPDKRPPELTQMVKAEPAGSTDTGETKSEVLDISNFRDRINNL